VFALVLLVLVVLLGIYGYWYSPFISQGTLSSQQVDKAVEEINGDSRPVINKGTFLTIENVYGEEYIKRFGEDKKQVVLTFDDGPDPRYTEKILKVLSQEKVHGTFYIVGSQMYKYPKIVENILKQGSDVGMHTFSHEENIEDKKLSSFTFMKEFDFTQKMFMHLYGYKPLLFRIPYLGLDEKLSYNSLQYIGEAYKRGLTVSAPTVDSLDWEVWNNKRKIIEYATTSDVQTEIILFHDAGGNRVATLQSLPEIISFYKSRGYQFITTTQLAEQNQLVAYAPISLTDKVFSAITYSIYHVYKQSPLLMQKGFVIGFVVVLFHTAFIVALASLQKTKVKLQDRKKKILPIYSDLISVIIPMHNEERSIQATIRSVLKSSYKNFEVLIIDDGSTDQSFARAQQLSDGTRVTVFSKAKGGKFSALNYGILNARGKIVVCIDADTRLSTSALKRLVQCFTDRRVAAVAGNIKIGNKRNFLTKMQSLEYIVSQSIEKRVTELFGFVLIVPGALGAWRKSVVKKAGGFTNQTHAEDFDLTLHMIKMGYKVRYCEKAIAHTEAPSSLKQLLTQRLRWNFGNLQVFAKHKDMFFNKKYGMFGLMLFPRFALVQIPAILLTPFVDLFIVLNLIMGERVLTLLFL